MRNILLGSVGITPQVVTETVYAMCVVQGRPVPDEIHLITSEEGAHRARLELLSPGREQLAMLCSQYGLPLPHCGASTIHVISPGAADENAAAADTTLEVVRRLTADPGTAIHFSIAGGRKTMTFYLGYCASLFARPQDEMSHVLVNAPFEQSPDFFFPPAEPVVMHDRTNRPHSTAEARIELSPVPFHRWRPKLPLPLLSLPHSFSSAMHILDTLDDEL